jgi:hypothetical protein
MAREFSANFLKRVVHFRYWLRRLQGKERNAVPYHVIVQIRELLAHDNIREIHYWNVRSCLKRLNLPQYYDNTISIMARLRGCPLAILTPQQEKVLEDMFLQLQEPFQQMEGMRVNMLFYPYVIRKLCEIRGWWTMARVIPTLKSHQRIMGQDMAWRRICEWRGWPFTATPLWTAQDIHYPNHVVRGEPPMQTGESSRRLGPPAS